MQNFLLEIIVPDNIWQMVAWYSALVVVTILYFVFRHKKKGKKRVTLLQEKIKAIEEFKEQLVSEKAMGKKDLYTQMFSLGAVSEFCKQTFETSQFVVYDEASKCLDKAQDLAKTIEVKKWKDDATNHTKTTIVEYLDTAVSYLSQAL